jgi:hypothetical protein
VEKASIEAFLLGESQSSRKNRKFPAQVFSTSHAPPVQPWTSLIRRDNALDIRSVITMEMNRINATSPKTPPPASAPLTQKPKPEPNAPKFMQALAEAVDTVTSKTLPSEPGALSRLVKPRSHLDLISLNPVQTRYVPASAALEKVGSSRILPFVAGE